MEDNEKIKQRYELLKMARTLLNEDYVNRRAEDHNKWVAENEVSWRTKRRNIPYPPFAKYPTDKDIISAAANLYNFIHIEPDNDEHTSTVIHSVEVASPPPAPVSAPPIAPPVMVPHNDSVIDRVPIDKVPVPKPVEQELNIVDETPAPAPTSTSSAESDVLQALRDKVDPTDTLSSLLINSAIQLEKQKKESTMDNVKKYLPGWVRRTDGNVNE
jgi:hypothetical protein